MIESISKIRFMANPIGPKQPGPLDMSSPSSAPQLKPLQGDTFQPSTVRSAYDDAVSHVNQVAKTTTDAVIAAQKGDSSAQKQLDVVV